MASGCLLTLTEQISLACEYGQHGSIYSYSSSWQMAFTQKLSEDMVRYLDAQRSLIKDRDTFFSTLSHTSFSSIIKPEMNGSDTSQQFIHSLLPGSKKYVRFISVFYPL